MLTSDKMLKEVDAFLTGDSGRIALEVPVDGGDAFDGGDLDLGGLIRKNISLLVTSTSGGDDDDEIVTKPQVDYDEFFADIWIGVVLTLLVLSCVCLMCSCLLYHKFQQWKRSVAQARNAANLESGFTETDLPSYTIASGLPSYEEALEQLKKVKELAETGGEKGREENGSWRPQPPPTPLSTLSVFSLFQISANKNVADCSEQQAQNKTSGNT